MSASPGIMLTSGDLPATAPTTKSLYPSGRGRLQRDDPVIGGIGPILTNEDSYDGPGLDSPMSHNGEPLHINGDLLLDGGFGSEKPKPQIDVFSDKAVKIDEGGLDQIFASDEEDESQEVRRNVVVVTLHLKQCRLLQGTEMTQFTFDDNRTGGGERADTANSHKVTKVCCVSPSCILPLTYVLHDPLYAI